MSTTTSSTTTTLSVDMQKVLEADRNTKYQWESCIFSLVIFVINGILFFWIPRNLRQKRYTKSNRFKPYFVWLSIWNTINSSWSIKVFSKRYFFKPTILILFLFYILLNGKLCYHNTDDIVYIPRIFVVAKRCARIGIAQIPAIFLLVTKGDFITGITGLTYERTTFLHVWFSFMMFVVVTFHVGVVCYYWASPVYQDLHPKYPKNAYGILAYVTFVFLALGNIKLIRKLSFDLSMVHHRAQSFIMLLMAFFHNNHAKAMVIIGVHLLVLDKVIGRIYGIVHGIKSPTKGWSEFEMLDEETMKVSIPIKVNHKFNPNSWFGLIKFKYGNWKAGSHIYFNVRKIDFFQHHPFCISSLPDSGKMVLIIRKRNGFTKKMFEKVKDLQQKQNNGTETESDYIPKYRMKYNQLKNKYFKKNKAATNTAEEEQQTKLPDYRKIVDPNIVILKTAFRGPSGAKCQPLITFDSVAFFAQELGATFILPIALDLLQTAEKKEVMKDYLGRPPHPVLNIFWTVKTKKHIFWLSHILDKMLKYIRDGRLTISVFVLENDVEMNTIEIIDENPFTLAAASVPTLRLELTLTLALTLAPPPPPPLVTTPSTKKVTTQVEQLELKKTNSSNLSEEEDEQEGKGKGKGKEREDVKPDYSLLNINYKPLDSDEALQSHMASVKYSDENHFRSMAVVCCGEEHTFGKTVEYNLQHYRWIKHAPNMYFYNESFDA